MAAKKQQRSTEFELERESPFNFLNVMVGIFGLGILFLTWYSNGLMRHIDRCQNEVRNLQRLVDTNSDRLHDHVSKHSFLRETDFNEKPE